MIVAQIPMRDDRKTGYNFGDITKDGVTPHPGEDLNTGKTGNSDLGEPVKAMAAGEVVFVRNAGIGWGNLVVIWHADLGVWTRCAHFQQVFVKVGDFVTLDTIVALCGKSGTESSHCHWEVIKKMLPSWTFYPNGWSLEKVKEYWESPYEFVERVNARSEVPEFAIDAVDAAALEKISMKTEDINDVVGDSRVEQIFINLGAIKAQYGYITKARLLVALYRLRVFGNT